MRTAMSSKWDVTIVTCRPLPEIDPDEDPLLDALAEAGLEARLCVWNDVRVDWAACGLTIIRSNWDYHRRRDEFLAWAANVSSVSTLLNPLEVVRWNSHKSYLLQLPMRGVPVVPTVMLERGSGASLEQICRAEGWERIVVKPAVSAGSYGTYVMAADALDEHTYRRLVDVEDVLVQPYVTSVDNYGERSLIFIDGAFSHCIRKHPRFAGDEERVTGPHEPSPQELQVAQRALDCVDASLLYGRVDLVQDTTGSPLVAELELIEPSLFFRFGPEGLSRFVAGIQRRLHPT
jgi:hypothetical protein